MTFNIYKNKIKEYKALQLYCDYLNQENHCKNIYCTLDCIIHTNLKYHEKILENFKKEIEHTCNTLECTDLEKIKIVHDFCSFYNENEINTIE